MKNTDWVAANADGTISFEGAQLAVLMDIRDELQRLNALLHWWVLSPIWIWAIIVTLLVIAYFLINRKE